MAPDGAGICAAFPVAASQSYGRTAWECRVRSRPGSKDAEASSGIKKLEFANSPIGRLWSGTLFSVYCLTGNKREIEYLYATKAGPTRERRVCVCSDAESPYRASGGSGLRATHLGKAGAGAPQPDGAIWHDRQCPQGAVSGSTAVAPWGHLDAGRSHRHQHPDGGQECPLSNHRTKSLQSVRLFGAAPFHHDAL